MASRLLRSALLASLAGCASPTPHHASQYRPLPATPPVVLAFAPGRDVPAPADAAQLRSLGGLLPAWVVPNLVATGPQALARARVVRGLLGRPVVLSPPGTADRAADPNLAVLFLPTAPGPSPAALGPTTLGPTTLGIVADDCRGPGQPVAGDLWPGNDARQPRLLPAGCAVAMAIQAQVTAASGGGNLLEGQPLPPEAATPFTDAIEAYQHRNDPGQRASPAASSRSGSPGATDASAPTQDSAVPASGGAPAQAGVNPLLGPLPPARTQ